MTPNAPLLTELPPYDKLYAFWLKVRENIFDGVEGPDCQEWAEEAGLFERREYNRERDGEAECEADDGDMLYFDRYSTEPSANPETGIPVSSQNDPPPQPTLGA